MELLTLLNGAVVGIFGIILSFSFCEILWEKRKCLLAVVGSGMLLLIQGIAYYFMEYEMVEYFYPVIMHIPLSILLFLFTRRYLWAVISVLTAYLCCQLRRWLALFIATVAAGDVYIEQMAELIVTIPLLFLLIKYISPAVRSVSAGSAREQSQFCFIPVVYYIFDYMTQIYLKVFLQNNPVVTEFMAFVCCIAYLIFILQNFEENQIRSRLEQMQDSLNLQVTQAVREIETLRKSQEKARQYRHDLRHHMQYISACIENGCTGQAKEYIHEICAEIAENKMMIYCENETANLIFSSFAARAKEKGILMKIQAQIPKTIKIKENDLCVLLSNALENALNACQETKIKSSLFIEIQAFEKKERICLQIMNSCDTRVTFERGIPVTKRSGHGMGVKSICALVEKYGGLYSFTQEDNRFVLRVTI